MRRIARFLLVLVAIAASSCGDAAATGPATPLAATPITPAPPPPTRYALSGTVKEAWIDTGLPGATATIASGPSGGSTVTDEHGGYTLSNLFPGIYRVTFSKSSPYGSVTYGPVSVFADAEFSGVLSLTGAGPVTTANLQGYWVA